MSSTNRFQTFGGCSAVDIAFVQEPAYKLLWWLKILVKPRIKGITSGC